MTESYSSKERLTYVAIQLFIRNGFNATSVQDICSTTGVSKGGFFHHFKSKEEAARAALTYAWALMEERLADARVESLADAQERLDYYLDWLAESLSDPECPLRVAGSMTREVSQTNPDLREAAAQFYENWERQILRVMNKHGAGPEQLARTIISVAEGAVTLGAARSSVKIIAHQLGKLKGGS